MNDKRESTWDWVTARANCSAAVMFEQLRQMAEANIGARNKQRGDARFHFMESEDSDVRGVLFTVLDTKTMHRAIFRLEDHAIRISGRDDTSPMAVTLTLTNEGECKLLVGDRVLEPWQLLREVLEPLLFRGF